MDEKLTIRLAKREDMKHVMDMIQELANFEEMPNGPKITAEILERDGFDSSPQLFKCFVAELQDETGTWLIGYSIFFNIYSTWEGKSMMMEDIYIRPEYRMKGAGKKMVKALVQHALDTGCCRLDFHVLKWNPARRFYEHLGAVDLTTKEEWLMYRLEKSTMENMFKNL